MDGKKQISIILFILALSGLANLSTLCAQTKTIAPSNSQNTKQDSVSKNLSTDIAVIQGFYQEVTASQERIFNNILTSLGIFITVIVLGAGIFSFVYVRRMIAFETQRINENLMNLIRPQFSRLGTLFQVFSTLTTTPNPQDGLPVIFQKTLLRMVIGIDVGESYLQSLQILLSKNAFAGVIRDAQRINQLLTREQAQQLNMIATIQQAVERLHVSILELQRIPEFEPERTALIALQSEMSSRYL